MPANTLISERRVALTAPGTKPEAFRADGVAFLDGLISHYVFDDGKLVVAHAGMPEAMQGRGSAAVREFALFGETTGETDEFGLPVRYNWAADHCGPLRSTWNGTRVLRVPRLPGNL